MTDKPDQTAGYLDLANQTFKTYLDAQSAWITRTLRYGKTGFEVVAKPYGFPTTPAALSNETLERVNSLVELRNEHVLATANTAVELGHKLADLAHAWQETVAQGAEELNKAFLSNLDAMKERTEQRIGEFAKMQTASGTGT